MPFDGTLVNVPSIASLHDWLEKQPPAKTYEYKDIGGKCLLGQYATAMNRGRPWWKKILHISHVDWHALDVYGTDFCTIAISGPYTFGAAARRAKRFILSNAY